MFVQIYLANLIWETLEITWCQKWDRCALKIIVAPTDLNQGGKIMFFIGCNVKDHLTPSTFGSLVILKVMNEKGVPDLVQAWGRRMLCWKHSFGSSIVGQFVISLHCRRKVVLRFLRTLLLSACDYTCGEMRKLVSREKKENFYGLEL